MRPRECSIYLASEHNTNVARTVRDDRCDRFCHFPATRFWTPLCETAFENGTKIRKKVALEWPIYDAFTTFIVAMLSIIREITAKVNVTEMANKKSKAFTINEKNRHGT